MVERLTSGPLPVELIPIAGVPYTFGVKSASGETILPGMAIHAEPRGGPGGYEGPYTFHGAYFANAGEWLWKATPNSPDEEIREKYEFLSFLQYGPPKIRPADPDAIAA